MKDKLAPIPTAIESGTLDIQAPVDAAASLIQAIVNTIAFTIVSRGSFWLTLLQANGDSA